jgi:cysteine desulfurase
MITKMPATRIYLDHAATTPLRPEAEAAMREGLAMWANPSSPHAEGRKARAALEDARARIKTTLGWEGELIFTSSASEALALGLGRAKADRRIVSAVEHDAVFRSAPGAEVLPIGEDWMVDRAALAKMLGSGPRAVVAIQHVNSETGAAQAVSELSPQVRESGGILISDCSQSAGKLLLPDADMIVISGHKLGGPIGIGALLVRDFAMLEPGGGQERGYRAGTENMPAALGFAAAVEARDIARETVGAGMNTQSIAGHATWLNTAGLAFVDIEYAINQRGGTFQLAPGHWSDFSILSITMPGVSANAQLIQFDAAGFAISAGSACSSGSLKPSRTLQAFGVSEEDARNTIRMSMGWNTRYDDVIAFSQVWKEIAAKALKTA